MSQIRVQKLSKQIERDVTDIIMNEIKDTIDDYYDKK